MPLTTMPTNDRTDRRASPAATQPTRLHTHLLIGYDGSAGAQHALRRASELFPGSPATVAYVWESVLSFELRHGGVAFGAVLGESSSDLSYEESRAHATALAGRDLARALGIEADAVSQQVSGSVWQALERIADGREATVIVVGTRGLTGIRSVLLGSVSRHLVERALHPVLVIPDEGDELPVTSGQRASDAVPPPDQASDRARSETAALADRLVAAWGNLDVEAFVALFSPDATLEIDAESVAVGKDRIAEQIKEYFAEPARVALTRRAAHFDEGEATLTLGVTLSRANGASVGPLTATVRLKREGALLSHLEISDLFGAYVAD